MIILRIIIIGGALGALSAHQYRTRAHCYDYERRAITILTFSHLVNLTLAVLMLIS